eukprot:13821563-Ditylum_brightwellii.AAC.1
MLQQAEEAEMVEVPPGIQNSPEEPQEQDTADATQPICKNALIQLATMLAWFYFSKPANPAFYNLCTRHKPSDNLCSLLGLGLKFCPTPRYTFHDSITTLLHFKRELYLKTYYAGSKTDPEEYNPKMYIPG